MPQPCQAEIGASRVIRHRSYDAEEFGFAVTAWQQDYLQLSAGQFRGHALEAHFDHVAVLREFDNHALIKQGGSRGDMFVLSLPLKASGNAFVGGKALDPSSLFLIDGRHFPEVITPAGLDVICVMMERAWFLDLAGDHQKDRLVQQVEGSDCLALAPSQTAYLRQTLEQYHHRIATTPGELADPNYRQHMELSIAKAILQAVDESSQLNTMEDLPHKIIADAARLEMLQDPSEPIDIERLCKRLSISRRHLQNCFQKTFGQSPLQILRAIRLNRARRELLSQTPNERMSIGDVAARWGFWHWSRFTSEYRHHFGELPSESIAQKFGHKTATDRAGVPKVDNG